MSNEKKWRSVARWPETVRCGNADNTSKDEHRTEGAAKAVCKLLRKHGFGGEGKIFPIETWVEEIAPCTTGS